jgi:prepilin-type N-terminal cleavage/methylation domain-containing protein
MFFLRSGAAGERSNASERNAGNPCRNLRTVSPRRERAGFTLVEVIVVLVILAILAAIAIPALTGYIDKADDRKWIAQARDAAAAARTVIDEAYAENTLSQLMPTWSNGTSYVNLKLFQFTGSNYRLTAEDLIGMDTAPPASWDLLFWSPNTSDYNVLNAPAYIYYYHPEGYSSNSGRPFTAVSFGIDGFPDGLQTEIDLVYSLQRYVHCEPSAGYKVFHLILKNQQTIPNL